MPDPRSGRDLGMHLDPVRPYLRVEICASLVPGDRLDAGRWYRFLAGLPLAGESWGGASAELSYLDAKGGFQQIHGANALSGVSGSDALTGQSASLSFNRGALAEGLAELMRPMDRVRIEVKHPFAPGGHRWTLFDGLALNLQTSAAAGSGFSSRFSLGCSGVQAMLQNAVFNWQGFIHPGSDILVGAPGVTLFEQLGHVAVPPHLAIRALVESVLATAMGLRVGDATDASGLAVLERGEDQSGAPTQSGYVKFGSQWTSLPSVANPLPWAHIVSQSGQSFWTLMQGLAEPYLHELFVGYRPWPGSEVDVPVLIHRPRPFPGLPGFNDFWSLPEVIHIGGHGQPSLMASTEIRNGARHPNCFHWAGAGVGDASLEAFLTKMAFGWWVSDALVNRYGYAPVGLVTGVAPLVAGSNQAADIRATGDWQAFCSTILENYARQEAPLALLGQRSLQAPFLPVRPGQILVDHSHGPDETDAITGYVVGTSFSLSSSGEAYSLEMGANVDRACRGTGADLYPYTVGALVPDLEQRSYAGKGIGDLGPIPAVGGSVTPPAAQPPAQRAVPSPLDALIPAAAASQGLPGWLLAHVCQQESSMGQNLGPGGKKGVCQITDLAVADLVRVAYKNPDGSPFGSNDRTILKNNLYAAAKYLSMCKAYVTAAGCPAAAPVLWTWVLAAYTNGPGTTNTYGARIAWVPPDTYIGAVDQPTYQRYYSQSAIRTGQAIFGQMG